MLRIAEYRRVSTDKQDTDMQRHAIQTWLSKLPTQHVVTVYEDEGYSGKSDKRPAFNQLCLDVKNGMVDMVLVYRLDRISRNASTALRLLLDWAQQNVQFVATDQPILNTTTDDAFRLTKLAMFAELAQIERETLVTRVKAGLSAAKARGVKLGATNKLTDKQKHYLRQLRQEGLTYTKLARRFSISRTTARRLCKEDSDVNLC